MEIDKLVITSKKYRGSSSVVSVRLPNDLVNEVDKIAKISGRTRNDVFLQCVEFAIDNLEIK